MSILLVVVTHRTSLYLLMGAIEADNKIINVEMSHLS